MFLGHHELKIQIRKTYYRGALNIPMNNLPKLLNLPTLFELTYHWKTKSSPVRQFYLSVEANVSKFGRYITIISWSSSPEIKKKQKSCALTTFSDFFAKSLGISSSVFKSKKFQVFEAFVFLPSISNRISHWWPVNSISYFFPKRFRSFSAKRAWTT